MTTMRSLDTIRELTQRGQDDQVTLIGAGVTLHNRLAAAARATRDRLIVVEAVHDLPGSGTPSELMAAAGISASHIAQAARRVVGA